jgi:hypothetical protein
VPSLKPTGEFTHWHRPTCRLRYTWIEDSSRRSPPQRESLPDWFVAAARPPVKHRATLPTKRSVASVVYMIKRSMTGWKDERVAKNELGRS